MNGTRAGRAVAATAVVLALAGCGSAPSGPAAGGAPDPAAATVQSGPFVLHRSATCGCCEGHERHLVATGMAVESVLEEDMEAFKDAQGVPAEARSCHTALIGGYVVEGHVPRAAIDALLRTRPDVDGIALPGMPPGSPGMDGVAEGHLEVVSFTDGQVAPFLTLDPSTR